MGKPHDDTARQRARQIYQTHGAQTAADATGIAVRSIRRWAAIERWPRRLAVADLTPEKVEARSQAARMGWHTRRRVMADQLGDVGAQLLEAIQRDLAQRRRLNLRDAGILLGIMLDKAELLAAVTAGTGTSEAMDEGERAARAQQILQDWQERKVADQRGR
jgi:hypothetical protein